jgi:SAM-dependent methyltransferase
MADQLIEYVRDVAQRLVGELERARRATRDWSEAESTDELIGRALNGCLTRLAETGCWGKANQLPSGELWRVAGDWLQVGCLQHHARFKPRGYAGDFEMLQKICDDFVCDHPLGRSFDRFFQDQAAPCSVRNRTRMIADWIVRSLSSREGRVLRIVSVGCGPAVELRHALRELGPERRAQVHATLLDLDPHALAHARAALDGLLPDGQLRVRRENLFRLARQARASDWLRDADLVYCAGLGDYLEDADLAALVRTCWEHSAPGGQLLFFNFTPDHPSRAYMEWVGNWYLIGRDEASLRQVVRQAGMSDRQPQLLSEPAAVSLCLRLQK